MGSEMCIRDSTDKLLLKSILQIQLPTELSDAKYFRWGGQCACVCVCVRVCERVCVERRGVGGGAWGYKKTKSVQFLQEMTAVYVYTAKVR